MRYLRSICPGKYMRESPRSYFILVLKLRLGCHAGYSCKGDGKIQKYSVYSTVHAMTSNAPPAQARDTTHCSAKTHSSTLQSTKRIRFSTSAPLFFFRSLLRMPVRSWLTSDMIAYCSWRGESRYSTFHVGRLFSAPKHRLSDPRNKLKASLYV